MILGYCPFKKIPKKNDVKLFILLFLLFGTSTSFSQKTPAQTKPDSTPVLLQNQLLDEKIDSTESYAQEFIKDSYKFQWGVRGGISRSRINISPITPVQISTNGNPLIQNGKFVRNVLQNNTMYNPGFSAGLVSRISRGSFFLQPEVVYSRKSGTYDVLDRNEQFIERVKAGVDLIEVPLLIGIKFRKGRVLAGPVGSFAFRLNDAFQANLSKYTTMKLGSSFLDRPVLNFQAGVGFQFGIFFVDTRYENGFSNYTNVDIGPDSNPSRFRFSANVFQVSVGFLQ
jgi:Outer membrane protein beta-barrel domain